jgi:hypothetical protein
VQFQVLFLYLLFFCNDVPFSQRHDQPKSYRTLITSTLHVVPKKSISNVFLSFSAGFGQLYRIDEPLSLASDSVVNLYSAVVSHMRFLVSTSLCPLVELFCTTVLEYVCPLNVRSEEEMCDVRCFVQIVLYCKEGKETTILCFENERKSSELDFFGTTLPRK